MRRTWPEVNDFDEGGRSPKPRNAGAGKGEGMGSSLETPGGTQP